MAPARYALPLLMTAVVIGMALLPRLIYLFAFSDPQNAGDGMTDTYHHWQIAYLTQQIGLSHGPRLWDLKGLEYFWGILHPILLLIVFAITGSIDIVLPRLVSVAFGVLTVVLLFHFCRRYWNLHVAFAVAALVSLAPPLIFNDALGMVDPVAIALLLLGIWLYPARGFLGGIAWGLAAMARAEAWILGFGLAIAMALRRSKGERRLQLVFGWVLGIAFYMNILLDQTGNPIYPVYWEFLVEATGRWLSPAVSTQAHAVQPLFAAAVLVSLIGLAFTVWKQPAAYLLLCYGFGSTLLVSGLLAFTPFISSWAGWVWRIRVLAFSIDYAFVLAAVFALVVLPRFLHVGGLVVGWAIVLVCLLATQLTWAPIQSAYRATEPTWHATLSTGRALAAMYEQPAYHWGRLNIPADQPSLTYVLARFGGVSGSQIIGQLYDPFYALPAGYRYDQHVAAASRMMACWLKSTKTSVIIVPQTNANYVGFVRDHSTWLTPIGAFPDRGWVVEAITAPDEVDSACG